MKVKHDFDCTIYAVIGCLPEHGICTCGYGWQLVRQGNRTEMYSEELKARLEAKSVNNLNSDDITKLFEAR